MSDISKLRDYVEIDAEKLRLIDELQPKRLMLCDPAFEKFESYEERIDANLEEDICSYNRATLFKKKTIPQVKYCPECGRKFDESENFCPDCLVILKGISDKVDVKAITMQPDMEYIKNSNPDNILTQDSLELISSFDFTIDDFYDVMHSIRAQAFKNMDAMIRGNDLSLDDMDVLDKVILFSKSFANVEYKSYGGQLGYFEFDRIYVDDRQRKSLQITTLIHELTHFLIKEILTRIVCEILDCTKNRHVESVVTYILTYSVFNSLIDEYAAHSVEGRFTIFGYQDYSSFTALQRELDAEHTDIAKTIGNTFSIHIKSLLEGFLDWDVREDIKEQFLKDTIEEPDYSQLRFESSNKLSDEGFMKAIWLILTEGFANADAEVIENYENQFSQ